ncbi:TPA: ead/Ea22-like family protein [Escherichia coli]|nr:ead/Ea22-like family protein [Escherichia coli]
MSNIDKQALNQEKIEWLNKLADMEYCKSNPGHWLMSLKDTNMLAKLALRSVALLDELERNQQYIKSRDQENEDIALTVGKLRVELEAAEKRIAELEAKLDSADKLQDSAFRHGLQHGFSFGQTDNQAGFEECLSAYGARGKDNG